MDHSREARRGEVEEKSEAYLFRRIRKKKNIPFRMKK